MGWRLGWFSILEISSRYTQKKINSIVYILERETNEFSETEVKHATLSITSTYDLRKMVLVSEEGIVT